MFVNSRVYMYIFRLSGKHKVIKTNLNKRKLALNSWLVKSSQLNLFSFNEDLV